MSSIFILHPRIHAGPGAEHPDLVLVEPGLAQRDLRVDDQGAIHPGVDLGDGIEVRVVHVRTGMGSGELMCETLPRLDRVLRQRGHPVHLVLQVHAVEVDGGRFLQLVLERNPHPVAFRETQHGAGHLPVEGKGLDGNAGRDFLPAFLDGDGSLADLARRLDRVRLGQGGWQLAQFACPQGDGFLRRRRVPLVACVPVAAPDSDDITSHTQYRRMIYVDIMKYIK